MLCEIRNTLYGYIIINESMCTVDRGIFDILGGNNTKIPLFSIPYIKKSVLLYMVSISACWYTVPHHQHDINVFHKYKYLLWNLEYIGITDHTRHSSSNMSMWNIFLQFTLEFQDRLCNQHCWPDFALRQTI